MNAKKILVSAVSLVTVAVIVTVSCNTELERYLDGRGQARRDLARGEFNVAIADGSNMPAFYEFNKLLYTRYHIGCTGFSLPANPRAAEAWVRGYNAVAEPRITSKFGDQVLSRTMSEAEELHKTMTDRNQ
jgi:hypothetical protein